MKFNIIKTFMFLGLSLTGLNSFADTIACALALEDNAVIYEDGNVLRVNALAVPLKKFMDKKGEIKFAAEFKSAEKIFLPLNIFLKGEITKSFNDNWNEFKTENDKISIAADNDVFEFVLMKNNNQYAIPQILNAAYKNYVYNKHLEKMNKLKKSKVATQIAERKEVQSKL